ncbi:non-ribosomal peptide synthetase [Antrihabitans cavernicola]|uniref:Amino acid adenylation domain-containing protein n=1 Tax=Antrihabitans cavernicola TaxID=2495913 RepID=A0A5A7SAF5_9NOCA|nr:non-ribosomal peptide synthetase [Spelaeibacter cavernicola]KAA0021543.1 amino acid adenylation domain-containing protein [Spelaeibacter cavernicola]
MKSLEDLQEAMLARLELEGLAAAPAVPARRDPERAPLSFGQRYVWAHQQISPNSSAYNLCLALTFDGDVDSSALRQAFLALVQRHEVLRTTYHSDDNGDPYQRIHDCLPPRSSEVDGPDDLTALMHAAAREPFDLSTESSLRVIFARVDQRRLVAIVTIQHIAWDGMTLPALSTDLEGFYRSAKAAGGTIAVEPLRLQVADFAEWEQDRFRSDDHSDDRGFWEARFDGELAELALPYDRRPATVSERGARSDRPLGAAADANLRNLSASLRVTPFSVFLAAYYVALRQITGQSDVIVGTTVANREEAGMELLIGNLSNMLPLRFTADGGDTFAELIEYVQTVTTDAFRHKHFPQEEVVRAVNRVTGHVGSALFDTMVLFLHQKIDGPQLPGAVTSWELVDNGAALLPVVVEVFMHDDCVDVQITYRTDLFESTTIDRLHEYIDQVLAAATSDRTLNDLAVLSESDRANVSMWSRGTEVAIMPDTVDAMIRESAQTYPDRIAVVFGETELTYADFDARVNKLARLLIARGTRTGDHVGVFAERSDQLPIAFAAVLRAGGVYLPIDPSYPADRIDYVLDDARPALVLQSASTVLNTDLPTIDLGDRAVRDELDTLDSAQLRPDELTRAIHPLDAAYLLYTSGTTGRPKGVVNKHRSVASHVQWMRDHLEFGSERILQKAPIGFDVSVFEMVNALCTGSASVLPPPDWWAADVHALADIIETQRVTQLSLVPSVLRAFLDAVPDTDRLISMRFLYLGGEAVPPALVEESTRAFGCTVLGLYGPTEAAMDLMHEDFVGAPDQGPALIGNPESNTTVHVLDGQLREVAPGIVGELYLAGAQLAQGYHRRPGLTASTFVACPFADRLGDLMYRTGDIARWNTGGRMEYLGRVDDQVKIRGHRIELGEVASVLRQAPGVLSAAAVALSRTGGPVLVGYYVSSDGDADSIRKYLAERLPDYMIPSALVRLDSLPLTANGKLDRKALPAPDLGENTGRGRPLQGIDEQTVAAVVRQVLGIADTVDLAADDDFLALGGDSISAIRMASTLKKSGLAITTSALFDARTIAAIAAATEPIVDSGGPALIDAGDGDGWIPLNPIATMLTDSIADYAGYSQATAVVTPSECTADRLTALLRGVVDRHPMLRSRIATDPAGDTAYYVPAADEPIEYPGVLDVVIDTDSWADSAPIRLQEQLHEIGATLDPHSGRMLGATWVHTSDGSHGRLLLVIHHLVVDGVSWRIIHDDLQQLWLDKTVDADTGTSVKTWNTNLAQLATDDAVVDTLPYWRGVAQSVDPLLGDRAFDPMTDTVATLHEVTTELDADATGFLTTTGAQAFGCDFLDIQVAALAVAVRGFRQAKNRDAATVSLTMERHGRNETIFAGVDLANAVGWFTSAYPVALDAGVDVVAAVKAVKEQLRAVPESGIGFGLLRWLNAETAPVLGASPAPQVSFNYMGRFSAEAAERDWGPAVEFGYLGGHADESMPAAALLDINTVTLVDDDKSGLRASFRFPAGPLDESDVRQIADRWTHALRELVTALRDNPGRFLTPSDVLARDVTQADLDRWQASYGSVADVYPLAPLQAGLYLTAMSNPGADAYTVQTTIGMRGELDVARLAHSVDTVLNRYPNLRVAMSVSSAGQPYAIVADRMAFETKEIDFSAHADAQDRLLAFLDTDQAGRFDLSRGPLMRATVVHLPAGEHMLVLTSHHILTDGWSGQLLPREIFADYTSRGSAAALGNPDTFARFLSMTEERERATEDAWSGYLDQVQPCIVAPNREPGSSGVPAMHRFPIDAWVADTLHQLASDVGTTFSVVCQLAWANVLRSVTGNSSAVFGEVVSGRPADLDDVDNAIGCFVNTIPVAIAVESDMSWRAHLTAVQRRRMELLEFHQYRLTSANRAAGARTLFDSMFVFQSYPSGRDELERLLSVERLDLVSFEGRGATDNALLLMVFPADLLFPGEPLQAVVFYAEDSFEPDDARIIETAYSNTLRAMAEYPDRAAGDVSTLDDDDEAALVMRRMWQ